VLAVAFLAVDNYVLEDATAPDVRPQAAPASAESASSPSYGDPELAPLFRFLPAARR
jgi:hypothetical protein